MNFQDLLNQPLPSKTIEEGANENEFNAEEALQAIEESVTNMYGDTFDPERELLAIESEIAECIATEDDDDDNDDDDDFDIDDLSDEEIAELDKALSDDSVDEIVGDDEDEQELSPEEEVEADDMMKVAATTMLVNDELNAEEKVAFLSDEGEMNTVISEGFMTETDINELAMESGLVTEAKYTNKMIIRLDAASKKKQLYALAVNVSAAAHNDKDYIKLKKVMKMRKILRARLERKYKTEATKRMKIYFKRLRNSKSNTLSNIGKKNDK